jgi:hypothetical protein
MSYADEAGFFIYKDKIIFNVTDWNVNNLTAYYNLNGLEGESTHVTLTVDPSNRYVKIYVNGVLSRASSSL